VDVDNELRKYSMTYDVPEDLAQKAAMREFGPRRAAGETLLYKLSKSPLENFMSKSQIISDVPKRAIECDNLGSTRSRNLDELQDTGPRQANAAKFQNDTESIEALSL
jgi:hypothetical protein